MKSSRDDPEDEGETDPGPPGVDQYESKAESEGRNISDDSGNESERKRDKENSNNLDANHAVVENDGKLLFSDGILFRLIRVICCSQNMFKVIQSTYKFYD